MMTMDGDKSYNCWGYEIISSGLLGSNGADKRMRKTEVHEQTILKCEVL